MGTAEAAKVLIAGGGADAVEAAITVRALAGPAPQITLICPGDALPLSAPPDASPGDPASAGPAFSALRTTHDIVHHRARLAAVDSTARRATLHDGTALSYDALLVATGVCRMPWLEGATVIDGVGDAAAIEALVARVDRGGVRDVAFAAPPDAGWTLPLYELALLIAARLADARADPPRLAVFTTERRPLEAFGPTAAQTVHELLSDRGVRVLRGRPTRFAARRLELAGNGSACLDEVVTLARLVGDPPDGLPRDHHGRIPADDLGAVDGLDAVWAVGDATTAPIRRSGLGAWQAGVAATAISAALGALVQPPPLRPLLHGFVLSGVVAAARPADARAPHDAAQMRRLALEFAQADALWGDGDNARCWLQALEWIDGAHRLGAVRARA